MLYKFILLIAVSGCLLTVSCKEGRSDPATKKNISPNEISTQPSVPAADSTILDTALYNRIMLQLLHGKASAQWPPKAPYPLPGAILPFNRIIAYYGNLYSKGMGILGKLPPDKMLTKLKEEVAAWQKADSSIKAIPALHYIAVTAQGASGSGSKYRLRMPDQQIDKIIRMADSIGALVFLDVQVGHSTLEEEIPLLEKYLKMANVHLGIDAEYSMKNGKVPSSSIGTFDAADVNFASDYLAKLVRANKLPPKILVVHRFTDGMLTNYRKIKTSAEVQIVVHMDGFGEPAKKINSYQRWVANQPVQFTGFKLFYTQDTKLMGPADVLKLHPVPVYIQYQ
jgi:hypothetical protein